MVLATFDHSECEDFSNFSFILHDALEIHLSTNKMNIILNVVNLFWSFIEVGIGFLFISTNRKDILVL